jgi:coenzyme F420-dependent glucose-6-phosphate dehydrogenase
MELGYSFSSEEHAPADLVRHAVAAERAGFRFGLISDHYHPWIDRQGHSPFVWSVIGAIANATERLTIGTGVTCPTLRIHPAIVAQAAATCACLLPGRFFLGVGTGENLNEHILGDKWPAPDERLERLAEAVQVIRTLWQGGMQTHRGTHFTVENARVYDLPDETIPIAIAAAQPKAAELAGEIGDALITVSADEKVVEKYRGAGGDGPVYAQVHVCWHEDERQARKLAFELWPNAALEGAATQELPQPEHFEQAAAMVDEDDVAESIVCGPNRDAYLERIEELARAGATHVYLHQIGPDQEGFLAFAREELLQRGTVRIA